MSSRNARYRKSEIKAGIWIFIALVIFAAFVVGITGARFWTEMDHYRVHLEYMGGLEVGSPVRMGGMLVGKISDVQFIPRGNDFDIELTLEVTKGLKVKENTTAYLSFISITSEQHLELERNPEPAPLLEPGALIPSKELTTMDQVMEQIGYVGDTLILILSQVHQLLKPENLAQIDSILGGVNGIIRESSPEIVGLVADGRRTIVSLDSLVGNIDAMVEGSDSLISMVLLDVRKTLNESITAIADIDSAVQNIDKLVLNNSGNLMQMIENLNRTSYNLKELSNTIKDNPFLLLRAFPKEERVPGR